MPIYKRTEGEEQPYWPLGPFKVRLPFIHYRWEKIEFFQALILFVVPLAMVPLLEKYLGLPYEIALAFVFIGNFGFLLPALLGVPFVPGWITAGIPVVLLFVKQYEPGPEAIQAMFAVQIIVAIIFVVLGATKLSSKVVAKVPLSIKAGILLGAGIAAFLGEIKSGGRIPTTPISITLGSMICLYMLFSASFIALRKKSKIAAALSNYGMVPSMIIAIFLGILTKEYAFPDIQMGITIPRFGEMLDYLPFTVGWPSLEMYIKAIPTAITAYIIAFGDVIVGSELVKNAAEERPDEEVDVDVDRVHLVTGMRNLMHSFLAPFPGLAGPIWTAVTATVSERFRYGRKAMQSIYSGGGTFWISGLIALFILPLVSFFRPFLPIGLSLTMVVTGYLCIVTGFNQIKRPLEIGVAGTMAVILASYGAAWGMGIGFLLYFVLEKQYISSKKAERVPVAERVK